MPQFSHSQHKSIFDAAFDIPYLALFRYPQIIPLQIQALTPCTSESWEEIVFILTPNHPNERGFSSKARLLHPPRFKSSSSHSRFLLLTHIFDSFHEKKKRIGIGSHMFRRQLEQLRVQPCIPHAPESEINPWKLRHTTEERSFPLFSMCTPTICPNLLPRSRELQLQAGMPGLGLKESRIRESEPVNTGTRCRGKEQTLQRSQGWSCFRDPKLLRWMGQAMSNARI